MGPKKKLTKKERARLEAEIAEQQRVELEKERLRKIDEEKERKIREKEDAEKRQKQEETENKLRRIQLQESYEHFAVMKNEIKGIYQRERELKEWERFMRCNGQPNAHAPGDLRKYLHIWLECMAKFNRNELNWILQISEQSTLTQDSNVINKTCEYLKSQQTNLGDTYSTKIKEVLGILTELESAVAEYNPRYSQRSIIDDLLELKIEFRNALTEFADEYSYKILCNITRDMDLDGMITATSNYESDVFKSQLYTVRSIPLPQLNPKEKLREETKHTDIEFNLISTCLTLPCTVKCANAAIRGIWFNYDHYSDYCPSFYIPYITCYKDDLRVMTRREWKQRKSLLKEAFEQAMKQQEKQPDSSSFDEQEAQPPTVIDIDKIYTDIEEEIINTERLKKGPEALNLGEYDVNLRSHRIIGGIYAVDYLEQPLQHVKIDNESLLRTVPSPGKLKRRIFYQPYKPPPPPQPGVRRLPEEIEAEIKTMEENLDKLALISVQLPENVFWFEPPIVCRWETFEEEKEAEALDGCVQKKLSEEEFNDKYNFHEEPIIKIIEDFDLHNIVTTCNCNLEVIVRDFVIPKLPEGYTIIIKKIKKSEKKKYHYKSFKIKQKKLEPKPDKGVSNTVNEKDPNEPIISEEARRCCIQNIKDILEEFEDEPKVLYVSANHMKDILKIIKKRDKSYQNYPKIKSPNDGDIDDDNLGERIFRKKKKKYMFSRFMEELDELNESKIPFNTVRCDEMNEKLNEMVVTNGVIEKGQIDSGNINEKQDEIDLKKIEQDSYEDDEQIQKEIEEIQRSADYDEIPSTETIIKITKKIGKWCTRDVHDVKFNEDKLTIQFRIGRLGVFGFAANRYSNLPYQTWEMKPDVKIPGSIIFSLTASVVSLELSVSVEGVRLNTLQGGPTSALQELIGETMSLQSLMRIMRSTSVDLFPDLDAFCYMEGSCEKNFRMESHLYDCMGELGLTHNFSWSRWNLLSGCRTCVLLIREIIEHRKVPNHQTLLVTPLKACVVDCTEVSPTFNTKGVPGMEYYADLHHLGVAHSQAVSRTKQLEMDPILRENISLVLKTTRPLSFC